MRRLVALAVVAIFLSVAAPARAAGGDMDPSFGNGGTKVFDMGAPWELVESVHVLRSGRLLVGGTYGRDYPHDGLVLARLQPWGGLDQTFGSGGLVKVATTGFLWGDSAVQPDGKILVSGSELIGGQYRAVVRRFTTAGAVDRQFGVLGAAVLAPLESGGAGGLALTSTGNIIVGGQDASSVFVTRLTPSGAIDHSFGSDGVARSEAPAGMLNVALERIAVTSSDAIVLGTALNTSCADHECTWEAGVAQLQPDGTPDPTFAGGGYTVIHEPGFDLVEDLAVGPGGTIYLAGLRHLFRLGADGALDPTFGSGGSATLVHSGDLDVAPDGRAVVAGGGQVSRFLADGTPDASFGGGDGVASYGFAQGAWLSDGDVDVQPDGRIVVGGTKQPAGGTTRDAAVFRLLG